MFHLNLDHGIIEANFIPGSGDLLTPKIRMILVGPRALCIPQNGEKVIPIPQNGDYDRYSEEWSM